MPAAIQTSRLTKRYGSATALADLDLRVEEGEIFGYLGPNGAGKSTTTKLLTTLIHATEGSASVSGIDVASDPIAVRRIVGYLPERVPVWRNVTAREYLMIFARLHNIRGDAARARIDELLDLVNLQDVDGKAVGKFSKGMTQRLGLARALLNSPRVLFLDEPASGLDPTGRKEIRLVMKRLAAEGTTIFLCTHDLAEAQAVCDRIGFVRGGRLVKVQAVNEIVEDAPRVVEFELDAITPAAMTAVRNVSGVASVLQENDVLAVTFTPPATRVALARAIHASGSVVVGGHERTKSVEKLYEEYVERPNAAAKDQEVRA